MSQLQIMDPQFECGLFEIWCSGIIDSLVYRANCGLDDLPYDVDLNLPLEQRLDKCEKNLDLPNLRSMKPELYEILLSKTGYLVRKHCADLCDPCDKLTFKSRFIDLIFLNVLRENQLITQPTEYYYESVLNIFSKVTFGLAFIIDVVTDQGWYKYDSKFLTRFADENQVELITTELPTLSSNFHLNVLFVIWNIESVLNHHRDKQALDQFKDTTYNLLNQSAIKTFDFKDNLAIYLALVNVTLEEYLGAVAQQAAKILGLDEQQDTQTIVNPLLPKVKVSIPSIEIVISFINDLGQKLFPNQEFAIIENLKSCFEDPKSESIIEMVASIIEIDKFLNLLSQEISFPKAKFEGIDAIMSGWNEWSQAIRFDEILCQEVLTLKRFFTQERKECRYLTCLIIKHGLPKYFDILESIDLELYLDPYVIYAFCDVLQTATETDLDLFGEMVLVLKRILTKIKSKKRISSFVKARVDFFGLYNLGNLTKAKLKTLLRQKSGAIRYDQIRDEVLLETFLSPYEAVDYIIGDTLEHSHHMIPFLCKLFCHELNGLMNSSCETKYNSSLFEVVLADRLNVLPTENTLMGMLAFIQEVFLFQVNSKKPIERDILLLDRLFCHLAWESCIETEVIVWAKLNIYKVIRRLSDQYDHIPWKMVKEEPSTLLYSLILMIDCCYKDGSQKTPYIELIAFVMNKKVQRKITSREFYWIKKQMDHHNEGYELLAYLEPWLEERLSYYIDASKLSTGKMIALAAIVKDNAWIYHAVDKRKLSSDSNPQLLAAIATILRFMHRPEFDNLFLFFCLRDVLDSAMLEMCEPFDLIVLPFNLEYITQCVIDCLYFHYKEYLKDPKKYQPIGNISAPKPLETLLPIFYRRISLCYYAKVPGRNYVLEEFLNKLALEMVDEKINVAEAMYKNKTQKLNYHWMAELILRRYHKGCHYFPPEPKIVLRPG